MAMVFLLILGSLTLTACEAGPSAYEQEMSRRLGELNTLAAETEGIEPWSLTDLLPQMDFVGNTVFVPELDDRTQIVVDEYPVDAGELGFAFVVLEDQWEEFARADDSVVLSKAEYEALIEVRDAALSLGP
jgi:hypothetical protein